MEKLAIIGTGIAGMGLAAELHKIYDLHLFEQNNYVGGHTNTISVPEGEELVQMDTGFMVFNYATYPNLCRLFDTLRVPVKKTSMSFSVQHLDSGLEFCGSGLNGLFAQRKNLFNIAHINMLREIARFNRLAPEVLVNKEFSHWSVADYFREKKFSAGMLQKYLIPMSSAVWSTPMDKMLEFPIVTLVRFFSNHGFLGLNTGHQWYTVAGGSREYRDRLIAPFRDRIQCNEKVLRVMKEDSRIRLKFASGESAVFDRVVFATHADQAISVIENPSSMQQELLSAFKYQKNTAVVHSDRAVMPRTRRCWSSWNYVVKENLSSTVYWMNSLQGVSKQKDYFVSINPLPGSVNEAQVIARINYEHPLFDSHAIRAQERLTQLNEEGNIHFCGSYFRYGFHEDAYSSGLELSKKLRSLSMMSVA